MESIHLHEDIAKKIAAPREGVYSQSEQYWIVRPIAEWEELEVCGWTSIGGPGVDGIGFCCNTQDDGIYAYFPIEGNFELIAKSVPDLIEGWDSGRIKV